MTETISKKALARDEKNLSTGTSPGWFKKSAAHWREVCRTLASKGLFTKKSELGGGADTPFEQAFANLAHAYLRDKAPNLLEYEVGFQLIEKNQENTKAVGVFGFKVGDQWLFAPVFFLNGDLKGHELLYIKNQDLFVPMKDNWLNYLLGRKPNVLGRVISRDLTSNGVVSPSLYRLARSPYKYASAGPELQEWVHDFMPVLGYLATTNLSKEASYNKMARLPDVLRTLGRNGFTWLEKVASEWPVVFRAIHELYGDELKKIAAEVHQKEKESGSIFKEALLWAAGDSPPHRFQPPQRGNGAIGSFGEDAWNSTTGYQRKSATGSSSDFDRYFHRDGSERLAYKSGSILDALPGKVKKAAEDTNERRVLVLLRHDFYNGNMPDVTFSEEDRQKAMEEGRVVKDRRDADNVTKVYDLTTSFKLFNPTETGIYDVLVRPNRFKRCLIIKFPYGGGGQQDFMTVISLENSHDWCNTRADRVFARSQESSEEWNKWFDSLEDVKDLPVGRSDAYDYPDAGNKFVILTSKGQGTSPVSVCEQYTGEGQKLYRVYFSDYCYNRKPYLMEDTSRFSQPTRRSLERQMIDICRIRLTGKQGSKLHVTRDELWVPTGTKKLTLKPASSECCSHSKTLPFELGDLADIQLSLIKNLAPLSLIADGSGVSVNGRFMGKDAAFRHLVVDWHLTADAADVVLEKAASQKHRRLQLHLLLPKFTKSAAPVNTPESGPSAPSIPEPFIGSNPVLGSTVPTMATDERRLLVTDMLPSGESRSKQRAIGPDAGTMQVAQEAAQTGQRDVFDTAVLGSLLKAVRQDTMIDRYQGDLMKGMDRLGRIYFQFLWHGEQFEERYGKQDLPELEDGLRNAFESVGDIILVLKRKSVEPFAEHGNFVDLSDVAN